MTRWLLDLEIDGQPYRWADSVLDVDAADGSVLVYRPGLADPGALAQGATDVEISITDDSVDWPSLVAELEGVRATLRRWVEGTTWEEAEVYAYGEVRGTTWGSRSEPVAFMISDVGGSETSLGAQIPDPLHQVDETTWPITVGHITGTTGAIYPVILGYPGWDGTTANQVVPVPIAQWQAATAATTYVVVSEDPDAPVVQVRLRNDDLDVAAVEDVIQVTDLLGQRVLVAAFTASATPLPSSETSRMYAGFRPGSGGGGVAVTAYEAVTYLLRRWGPETADWSRLPEARGILDGYQVDSWIDDVVTDPWAWIEDVLLPDLPVEVRTSSRGRYLLPRRYTSDPSRLVGELDADSGAVTRVGPVSRADDGPTNEWSALYRASREGDWLGRVILTGDPSTLAALDPSSATQAVTVITTGAARASYARYRLRQAESIEIDWSWDTGTVARCLEWRAERDALPAALVDYEIADGEDIQEGDEYALTDSELGWTSRAAIVDAPPVRGITTTVTLRVQL